MHGVHEVAVSNPATPTRWKMRYEKYKLMKMKIVIVDILLIVLGCIFIGGIWYIYVQRKAIESSQSQAIPIQPGDGMVIPHNSTNRFLVECLTHAYFVNKNRIIQTCTAIGQESNCQLPQDMADSLSSLNQKTRSQCYVLFVQ